MSETIDKQIIIEYLDSLLNYIDTKHPKISMIRGSLWSMKEQLSNKKNIIK